MTLSAQQKGKGRLLPQESVKDAGFSRSPSPSSTSSSQSSSESESDEDSSEDEEDDVSQEYLDSLLEKARRSIASKAIGKAVADKGDSLEEDIIVLDDPESELKCVFFYIFPIWPDSQLIQGAFPHWTRALYRVPTSLLGKHLTMPR